MNKKRAIQGIDDRPIICNMLRLPHKSQSLSIVYELQKLLCFFHAIKYVKLLFPKLEFKLFTKRERHFAKKRYICVL